MLATFIGGCAGSSGGGIKVMRWVLVSKQAARESSGSCTRAASSRSSSGEACASALIDAVWGFFTIYSCCSGC
jgi:trk system potassium uptake protein TrkH